MSKKRRKKGLRYWDREDGVTIEDANLGLAWDSGLKVTPPKVVVSRRLVQLCATIQSHVKEAEFSFLCKGGWGEDGFEVDATSYLIPRQKVSLASVDYLEPLDELRTSEGYNVVVHSHPFSPGQSTFSAADRETICSHFDCSLLYTGAGIVYASLTIQVSPSMKVIVEGNDLVEIVEEGLPAVEGLDKIEVSRGLDVRYGTFRYLPDEGWEGYYGI